MGIFFAAGYETTAHAITWALFELAADPSMQVGVGCRPSAVVGAIVGMRGGRGGVTCCHGGITCCHGGSLVVMGGSLVVMGGPLVVMG